MRNMDHKFFGSFQYLIKHKQQNSTRIFTRIFFQE